MRRYKGILAATVAAMMITACGSGDGIVINGTTAAEMETTAESQKVTESEKSTEDLVNEKPAGGTKIEIVTGETTAAVSLEGQTELETTQAVKPQETTAAPTTAAPTKAPETTAAKKYSVKDVEKTMYATSSVRVRSSYSTSSEVLGALKQGEKVEVTGESENGWMRVSYKGHTAYVSKDYLTETAPAATSTGQTTTTTGQTSTSGQTSNKPTSTTNNGTTPGGSTTPGGTTTPTPGGSTTPGGTTTPTPGGSTTPGGTTTPTPGGSTTPGGTTSSGGSTAATGTAASVSGNITSLDPSGVTIQASDGKSYTFVWGATDIPALAPGEKISIQYVTNGSTNTVTQVNK